jgi:Swt1-like HEPN
MNKDDKIRLFRMTHQMLESDLDRVEKSFSIDLGRESQARAGKDEDYYPQFSESVRQEAASMAEHYEVFYCLEQSIRDLVRDKLAAEVGSNWWEKVVTDPVKLNVDANITRERDSGVTMRSTEKIDYTTFGELGEIVRANWPAFSDTFNSQKAFTKIMTNLNVLRAPIAHCCPLAEDEAVRLRLTVRDWFRLME